MAGTTRRRRPTWLAVGAAVLLAAGCGTDTAPKVEVAAGPAAAPAFDGHAGIVATTAPRAMPPATGLRATRAAAANLGASAGGALDIAYAREVIARGGVPDPRAITAEGLYAESDLPLEGAAARDLLSLNVGVAVAEGATLVQIGMSSNLDVATWRRAPLNLCLVVDVSGSMNEGGKMEATKRALRALLARLGEGDVVSLVTFAAQAHALARAIPATDRATLEAIVDGLRANGSTNMHEGMRLGYDQVAATGGARGGRNPRLILFTDALPNTGNFSDAGFLALASRYGREGIGLTAFGVGIDFGHDLARKIAECPGGNYKFLRDAQEIANVFEADFDYLVTPLAYDLAVEVHPAPGFEIAESYGFPGNGFRVATVFLSRNKGALAVRLRRTGAPVEAAGDGVRAAAIDDATRLPLIKLCDVTLAYRKEADGGLVREDLTALAPPVAPETEHFSHRGVRKTLALTMLAIAMKDACAPARGPRALARLEQVRARLEGDARALGGDADLEREAKLAARLAATLQAQASVR